MWRQPIGVDVLVLWVIPIQEKVVHMKQDGDGIYTILIDVWEVWQLCCSDMIFYICQGAPSIGQILIVVPFVKWLGSAHSKWQKQRQRMLHDLHIVNRYIEDVLRILSTREVRQTCRRQSFNTKSHIRKTSLNLVHSYCFKMYNRAPTEGNCMADQIQVV